MKIKNYDCWNCNHHWQSEKPQETCVSCNSWAVMTTDEFSEHDSKEQIFEK